MQMQKKKKKKELKDTATDLLEKEETDDCISIVRNVRRRTSRIENSVAYCFYTCVWKEKKTNNLGA